ncbi:MAG: hypothetical protein WKI04_08840 [Ferruginibacter sp.]
MKKPKLPQRVKSIENIGFFSCLFLFSLFMDFTLDYIASMEFLLNAFHINNTNAFDEEIYREGFPFAVLVVGLMVPAFEEFLHRYYLRSFTWNNTLLPICCAFIFIQLLNIRSITYLLIIAIITLSISIGIYRLILKSEKVKKKLLQFYAINYWLFFYISAIAFGVSHIGNYNIKHFIPILPVILLLPQIFAGLLLGYVRIVMGIKWSIAFHSLHNLIVVTFLFINHR